MIIYYVLGYLVLSYLTLFATSIIFKEDLLYSMAESKIMYWLGLVFIGGLFGVALGLTMLLVLYLDKSDNRDATNHYLNNGYERCKQ